MLLPCAKSRIIPGVGADRGSREYSSGPEQQPYRYHAAPAPSGRH